MAEKWRIVPEWWLEEWASDGFRELPPFTLTEEHVEAMARAACRALYYCDLDKPDGRAHWESTKDQYMAEARAAGDALRKAMEEG